ncbi:aconitate hydratase [Viridibacillus sp. YIM B01967]|uniref:Aconitate hydratase n=1 Tax=Viridibacillus soli TaxID=2798301 RepID=A0ABS1HDY6_9BACL|nr:aconitate hydratase [Viridibacillus soli]MBK3497193.1 aconitate hydratase [Viridibacillus soli]
MISIEERNQLHQYLIYELAIQSLQKDHPHLEKLKMKNIYLVLVDVLLKDLKNDYYKSKHLLKRRGIQVIGWHRTSEYFSDIQIRTAGEDLHLNYAKQALKTAVEEELFKRLQLQK